MKKNIHPKYNSIVFHDLSSNFSILTKSTLSSKRKILWHDNCYYPIIDVEISSTSHPFYTGKQRIIDSAGRVERFKNRFKNF